jgi:hypothetical protein
MLDKLVQLPVPKGWRGDLLLSLALECTLRGWVPRVLDNHIPGSLFSKKHLRRCYRLGRPPRTFPLCVANKFLLMQMQRTSRY